MEIETQDSEIKQEAWPVLNPGRSLGREKARIWALVLDARGVPCCLEQPTVSGWEIHVPADQLERACREISKFEEKNLGWPPPLPILRPMKENSLSTLSILILLATFYNIVGLDLTLPGGGHPDWFAAGSSRSSLILGGEWWRVVTSLTLHRDLAHLLGNLSIGGLFVFLLCRDLGSGLAWSLILASGSLGNLANALVQPASHNSVGASTAVFGAVGILAALNMVRYRGHLQKRWGLPVAAALALLTILGTEGKNTDLGAHFFGFVAGVLLGLVTEKVISLRGHPSFFLNSLLAFFSGLTVIVAWLVAVSAG